MDETAINGHEDPGKQKRIRCAELFVAGTGVHDLALAFGVTESTVYRWLRDPLARQVINDTRRQAILAVVGSMTADLMEVRNTLKELTKHANGMVALGACRAWFDYIGKLDNEEIEQRVTELERLGKTEESQEQVQQ